MGTRSTGDQELARRLEAYARARLSPDRESVARIRARVMREARVALDQGAAGPPSLAVVSDDTGQPTPIRRARFGKVVRRGATVLLAAVLSLTVLGGIALGAQPGGPLYGARLWLEAATLPANPADRSAADFERLQERFDEAVQAANEGNTAGVAAAVAAYNAVVDDAIATAGGDEALLDRLQDVISRHLATLQALLDKVPEQARPGIQNAIDKSDNALTKAGGQGSQGNGPDNRGSGGQGGGQGGGADRTPKPTPAATPNPTPKPTRTPSPPAERPQPPKPPQPPVPTPSRDPNQNPGGPPASHPGPNH